MPRRKRHQALIQGPMDTENLTRLWILRLLVPLGGHRQFIDATGFSDDNLARAIGLDSWNEEDDLDFNRREVLKQLRTLHQTDERKLRNAAPPEALRRNAQRLSEVIGLDDTARRILEFAVILHDTPLLDDAMDLLGQISTSHLYRILAVLLEVKEQQVKDALSSQGPLARSGLVTVDHNSALKEDGRRRSIGFL